MGQPRRRLAAAGGEKVRHRLGDAAQRGDGAELVGAQQQRLLGRRQHLVHLGERDRRERAPAEQELPDLANLSHCRARLCGVLGKR